MHTVPVALSSFFSQFQNDINWVAAGCLISILPATLVYLFLQRYFVKGLTDGVSK
jgi:raffinose/stachyose/melibiose transport system permease protein